LLLCDIDISQDSVVTHLRCGRIYGDSIMEISSWFRQWKKFENWSIFNEVIRRTKCANFGGHPVGL